MEIDFRNLPKFADFSFKITALVPEWSRAYGVPESAIIRQLSWAHGWIASNPRKAPKKDPVRFLFNWMRKAKQFGNLVPPAPKIETLPPPADLTTHEDVLEMHRQTVATFKRCPRRGACELCAEMAARETVAA